MNPRSLESKLTQNTVECVRKWRSILLSASLALVSVAPAWAHHSFAAEYDINKPVRLVGELTKIEWTNPHSYFYLKVKNAKGEITDWTVEGAGPGALSRRGFKKGLVKIGDTLIVDGYLAKSGGKLIDGRRVTLPDGQVINGGTPGDGGPDSGPAETQTAPPAKAP